jgi:hypothetical protein
MYNQFPIQVNSLTLGSNLQGQLDENGLVAVGSNEAIPAPVIASLGQISGNVALQIEETVSMGSTFTTLLTSRLMQMARIISDVPYYFFQVSSTALTWTDTDGDSTTLNLNKGATQLAFSKASVNILSGENSLISSTDSTHMSVGNSNQALALTSSLDGISVSRLNLNGPIYDGAMSEGTAGQVLSSTSTGVQWINGGGAVNSVDTKTITGSPMSSNSALRLESSVLPAGSYLVNYDVKLIFNPLAGAGMQESFLQSFITDDYIAKGLSKDSTVRNLAGGTPVDYYLQSSGVVVLSSPGTISGYVTAIWSGGVGGSVTASGTITSTLVNV